MTKKEAKKYALIVGLTAVVTWGACNTEKVRRIYGLIREIFIEVAYRP